MIVDTLEQYGTPRPISPNAERALVALISEMQDDARSDALDNIEMLLSKLRLKP